MLEVGPIEMAGVARGAMVLLMLVGLCTLAYSPNPMDQCFFVIWEDARHDCFAADMWNDRILLWGGVDPEYSEFDDVHLEYCWDYFEEPCRYDASDSFFNYSDRAFRPWYMLSSRCTVQDGLEF